MYRLISGFGPTAAHMPVHMYRGYQEVVASGTRVYFTLRHMPVTARSTPGLVDMHHAVHTLHLLWKA